MKTHAVALHAQSVPILILMLVLGFAVALCGCSASAKKDEPGGSSAAESGNQAPDNATACRELAPGDPYTEKDERSEAALDACRAAAEAAPDDADMQYRLGVSALQSDQTEEAVAAFRKAEHLGSCQALVYLGDVAWFQDHDASSADVYYQKGAACGDRIAARQIFSPETYAASAYPDKIAALYNSDMETLNRVRFLTASYVDGFYEALSEQFLGKEFDPCWTTLYYRGGDTLYGIKAAEKGDAPNFLIGPIYEQFLPVVYRLLLPEQGERALEEVRETARKAGHADLLRMVQSSKCGALLPRKIIDGIETFAKTRKSLFDVAQQQYPNIHSLDDLTSLLRGSQ
jgi:hypothetical protein